MTGMTCFGTIANDTTVDPILEMRISVRGKGNLEPKYKIQFGPVTIQRDTARSA